MTLVVGQGDRTTAPRVLCGDATPVRFEPPSEIDGDSRVERAIATSQDVNRPVPRQILLPSRVVEDDFDLPVVAFRLSESDGRLAGAMRVGDPRLTGA